MLIASCFDIPSLVVLVPRKAFIPQSLSESLRIYSRFLRHVDSPYRVGIERPLDKIRNPYASVYFPRSIIFCAICCLNSIVLNGSYFASRRRIAS